MQMIFDSWYSLKIKLIWELSHSTGRSFTSYTMGMIVCIRVMWWCDLTLTMYWMTNRVLNISSGCHSSSMADVFSTWGVDTTTHESEMQRICFRFCRFLRFFGSSSDRNGSNEIHTDSFIYGNSGSVNSGNCKWVLPSQIDQTFKHTEVYHPMGQYTKKNITVTHRWGLVGLRWGMGHTSMASCPGRYMDVCFCTWFCWWNGWHVGITKPTPVPWGPLAQSVPPRQCPSTWQSHCLVHPPVFQNHRRHSMFETWKNHTSAFNAAISRRSTSSAPCASSVERLNGFHNQDSIPVVDLLLFALHTSPDGPRLDMIEMICNVKILYCFAWFW